MERVRWAYSRLMVPKVRVMSLSMKRWVKCVIGVVALWSRRGRSVSRRRSLRVWTMSVGRESLCLRYSLVITEVIMLRRIQSNLPSRVLLRRWRKGRIKREGSQQMMLRSGWRMLSKLCCVCARREGRMCIIVVTWSTQLFCASGQPCADSTVGMR